MGKAKVAHLHGHTIPHLELCAAVQQLSLVKYYKIKNEEIDTVKFYTDSEVVLGYTHNQTLYVYIENRANHILRSTKPEQ